MDIRADWITTQVKHLASYTNGYAFSPEDWGDVGTPIIRIQNLTNPENAPNRTMACPSEKFRVESGDILIPWSGSIGVHQWTGETAWLNQHIFKVSPKEGIDKRYFWWLANYFVPKVAERAHGSTMQHLTKDAFGTFEVQLPPLATQTAIADYLDRKTAAIDALIAKKELLIEELRKYQEAVIAEVVTRCIGENEGGGVRGTDEGGGVMSFKTASLKRLFKIVSGSTPASDIEAYWNGPVTWVTPVDLSGGAKTVAGSTRTLSKAGYEACGTTKVPAGSLILSTRAPIGSIAIAAAELCTNQGCKALVPVTGVDSRYFYYQLSVKAIELNSLGRGSTFLELSTAALGDFEVYAPPRPTQTAIADNLDAKTAAIRSLIDNATTVVAEYRKLRAALITEAVTGEDAI